MLEALSSKRVKLRKLIIIFWIGCNYFFFLAKIFFFIQSGQCFPGACFCLSLRESNFTETTAFAIRWILTKSPQIRNIQLHRFILSQQGDLVKIHLFVLHYLYNSMREIDSHNDLNVTRIRPVILLSGSIKGGMSQRFSLPLPSPLPSRRKNDKISHFWQIFGSVPPQKGIVLTPQKNSGAATDSCQKWGPGFYRMCLIKLGFSLFFTFIFDDNSMLSVDVLLCLSGGYEKPTGIY